MRATLRRRTSLLATFALLAASVLARPALGAGGISPAERQALLDLYSSTNGAGWTNSGGWLGAAGTECLWFGVTCDQTETTVQSIALPGNGLVGPLPATIGDLTGLGNLNLAGNALSGSIPVEIGTMTSLEVLELSANGLTGAIPSTIDGTVLRFIYLQGNSLSGPIPAELWNLTNMVALDLTGNALTGTLPAAIGNLTSLDFLSVSFNGLSGPIPPEIGTTSLSSFGAAFNALSGTIPVEIGTLTGLTALDLTGNALSGSIPQAIGSLTNLTFLGLGGNALSGSIPIELGSLPFLDILDLQRNALSGPIPSQMGSLLSLSQLYLNGNALEGPLPLSLMALEGLSALDISHNALFSTDGGLTAFLDAAQPGWHLTQTIAPTGVNAVTQGPTSVLVSWTPIPYTGDAGSYDVYYATGPGGPYTLGPSTANKAEVDATVVGLMPGETYYFVVRTTTLPNLSNPNTVTSGDSAEVSDTTTACTYDPGPPVNVPAAGGTGLTSPVTTQPGCPWTTGTKDFFITITSGSGVGSGAITFDVDPNTGPARMGQIVINGTVPQVVQQDDGCAYSLLPTSAEIAAGGATEQSFQVQAGMGCEWNAVSNDPWITVLGGGFGSGNGLVGYDVAPNAGPARSGTITVAGETFTVNQAGTCSYTLVPTSANVGSAGASGQTFDVQTGGACPWTAVSNDAWITVTGGGSGVGNGTVTYDVAANAGPARSGTITAGGETFTVNQADGCAYSLLPTSANVAAGGDTGQTFQVLTGPGCAWTSVSDDAWISITGGASGSGNGTVTYDVGASTGPARSGTITAAGQTFTVNQADGCQAALLPTSANVSAAGAAGQGFQVLIGASCPWTAVSNDAWITITGGASGSGNGNVTYDVAANVGPARNGTITAAGQTFTVNQGGGCSATLLPTSANAPAAGAAGQTFQVQTPGGCPWTATSNAPWITVTGGASGSGNGTVTYSVAANAGPARNGTITAAGETFTVNQADGCTATLVPATASVPAAGATNQSFQVQTTEECSSFNVVSNDAWIVITGASAVPGLATFTYDVAANTGPARSGTVTAADKTFTVNQASGCTFALVPTSANVPASGASGPAFDVQTAPGCAWSAVSNDAWIAVTGGASGAGNGTVSISVGANTGPARSGTITAAGQTFTVNQADGCAFTLLPTSASATAAGGSGLSFQVQTALGCAWTAASNDAWITITGGASGSGTGAVTYSVAANSGPARSGTITAGGHTFTVNQASGCAFTLLPTSASAPAAGASGQTFQVQTAAGCAWTAASSDAWITVTGGGAGTGPGNVTYQVGLNAGPARTGTITAAGQTFTVNQADGCAFALLPTGASVPASGAAGQTFGVQTAASCAWTATSNAPWITLTGATSGAGPGNVTYDVASNAGPARTGTITAAGQTFTVSQADGCSAGSSLVPAGQTAPGAGATGLSFQVQTNAACPWTAVSNAPWITLTGATAGTGSATVTYDVAPNPGVARAGTIAAAGQTFTVSQGDGCFVLTSVSPENVSVPAAGDPALSFQVVAPAACAWDAISNTPWIAVASGLSGTGDGSVTISVAANPDPVQRFGFVSVAGATFTVTQDAATCSFQLSPPGASAPASGMNGSFQVQGPSGCSWSATSSAPWIALTGPTSGPGGGSVAFAVAANPDGLPRSAAIVVSGETFAVTQAAAACTFALQPASATVPGAGATGLTFQIQTLSGCASTAIAGSPWITIASGATGTGTRTVTFDVVVNTGAARTGTILAGGETFTVDQPADCTPLVTPQFTSYPASTILAGTSFTLAWSSVVTATGTYEVRLSSHADCSSPTVITTAGTSVTVPTDANVPTTLCAVVRAFANGFCPDLVSGDSSPVVVRALPPPASFDVIQGQSPAARATVGQPPPTGSTVVFRNVGSSPGVLTLAADGGFFSVSPASPGEIAPGADVVVTILFAAGSTTSTGLQSGSLTGSWSAPDGTQSVSTSITLTVLDAPGPSSVGAKLEPVGSNRIHFRHPAGSNPDRQTITIRNTGGVPVRIAPAIGPGGTWLDIAGEFAEVLGAGDERSFELIVDRSRRTTYEEAPLGTVLRIDNVDGNPEDGALFNVFDDEPPPPTPGTNRPDLTETEFSLIMGSTVSTTPAGGRAGQAVLAGAQYLSDGWIRNRSSDPVSVDLYYTPSGLDGITGEGVKKNTITLKGYATFRLSDFIQGLFQETGSGHVELRSTQLPQLSVRTTVDTIVLRDGVPTQYGAEIPILVSGQGVGLPVPGDPTEVILLAGVQGPLTGHRTNVILAETLGRSIEARLRLYDTGGRKLGERTVYIGPYSKTQVNGGDPELFPVPYGNATIEIEATAGEGEVAAFATVLDNASLSYTVRVGTTVVKPLSATSPDPTRTTLAAPGQASRAAAAPEKTAFIPTIAHGVTDETPYRTRLAITNASEAEVTLRVSYVPEPGYGGTTEPRTVVVPARAESGGPPTLTYEDVLKELLGVEDGTRGMLRVEGGLADLVFASETTTPLDPANPEAGSSVSVVNPAPGVDTKFAGVFYADSQEAIGVKASEADTVKTEVSLPAIEDGAEYRSSLVLAELAGQPAKVKVVLRKTGGAPLGEPLVVTLAANERKQINRIIPEIVKPPSGVSEFKDVEINVTSVEGKGRTVALINRVSNDPKSKRTDTYVLGPPVSAGSKRKGQK